MTAIGPGIGGSAPDEATNPDPVVIANAHSDHDSPAQTEARKLVASARIDADVARTDDQRRISGIWERTQQIIALMVVVPTVITACSLCIAVMLTPNAPTEMKALAFTAFTLLATLTGSVIGFYFGRTNHQRVGGNATAAEDVVGR